MSEKQKIKSSLYKISKQHRKDVRTEGKTTFLPISVTVNAPAAVTWQVFGLHFGTFLRKAPGFSRVISDVEEGSVPALGNSRYYTIVGFAGQERLKWFDTRNYKLSYDIPVGPPPAFIRNAANTWSVKPADDRNTSVFQMQLQGDYTWLGRVLKPLIQAFIQWPTVEAMSYTVKYEAERIHRASIQTQGSIVAH